MAKHDSCPLKVGVSRKYSFMGRGIHGNLARGLTPN